jgi:hypothetical protein
MCTNLLQNVILSFYTSITASKQRQWWVRFDGIVGGGPGICCSRTEKGTRGLTGQPGSGGWRDSRGRDGVVPPPQVAGEDGWARAEWGACY